MNKELLPRSILGDHPFRKCAKLSEKLTFLTNDTQTYVRVSKSKNISFSEHFAYVLYEWYLAVPPCHLYI